MKQATGSEQQSGQQQDPTQKTGSEGMNEQGRSGDASKSDDQKMGSDDEKNTM